MENLNDYEKKTTDFRKKVKESSYAFFEVVLIIHVVFIFYAIMILTLCNTVKYYQANNKLDNKINTSFTKDFTKDFAKINVQLDKSQIELYETIDFIKLNNLQYYNLTTLDSNDEVLEELINKLTEYNSSK